MSDRMPHTWTKAEEIYVKKRTNAYICDAYYVNTVVEGIGAEHPYQSMTIIWQMS